MHLLQAQAQYARETETTEEVAADQVPDLTSGMRDLQTSWSGEYVKMVAQDF